MGDSLKITSIVLAVLFLGSIGFYQESFAITSDQIKEKIKTDDSDSRPTFGLSHDKNRKMIDKGFSFNNKTFSISNNYHTPFAERPVILGEVNSFEAKVYAENNLKVQEFLFGIPNKGQAHLAELGIEVWYGLFGEIEEIKVIQKSNVIDIESVTAAHEKTKCRSRDKEEKCDATNVSMVFLEPLKAKVMAIKAIDYKNRYHITYLNEGFDISGDSLNPMPIKMIPSPTKGEGLIKVTQNEKYSNYWTTDDERTFEINRFGSFKQINYKFERFQDSGEPRTRLHSEFGGILAYEQDMAKRIFDSSKVISELPESHTIVVKPSERVDEKMKQLMLEQELICKKYLEDQDKQARW
ncbi:MAG: hypothetical protein OEQ12_04305 [Nitrosopumilus sp.]|nr:hypothetical protein [Nitrosopumilus sp.]